MLVLCVVCVCFELAFVCLLVWYVVFLFDIYLMLYRFMIVYIMLICGWISFVCLLFRLGGCRLRFDYLFLVALIVIFSCLFCLFILSGWLLLLGLVIATFCDVYGSIIVLLLLVGVLFWVLVLLC